MITASKAFPYGAIGSLVSPDGNVGHRASEMLSSDLHREVTCIYLCTIHGGV